MKQDIILYNLWERTCKPTVKKQDDKGHAENWVNEVSALYTLGIGIEETLRFLYFDKPSLNEFKNWLDTFKNKAATNLLSNTTQTENILTTQDLDFWNENGYVVLQNAITKQQCLDTQKAIWEFLDMDVNNPFSWYTSHPEQRGLMLLFSHHPTLDANRESIRIRKAYEQLYNSTEIYKTIDKVSFNPPETNQFHFLGSKLHWDVSLSLPIPFSLQGLLYLTDCNANEGAFHCVPGFHRKIENWLNTVPPKINPREEALRALKPIPVTGKAGDFIIWHQALPHCASPNHGTMPRMVQYLTYLPKQQQVKKTWK